jgi:hypothetical protein
MSFLWSQIANVIKVIKERVREGTAMHKIPTVVYILMMIMVEKKDEATPANIITNFEHFNIRFLLCCWWFRILLTFVLMEILTQIDISQAEKGAYVRPSDRPPQH